MTAFQPNGMGKQARVLSDQQQRAVLVAVGTRNTANRDRAMILLSFKAGLRAKEIAKLQWRMVLDGAGRVGDALALENRASKGRKGGRLLPVHPELKIALATLYQGQQGDDFVILDTRGTPMTANNAAVWFMRLYRGLGFEGCSSHSGRRTFGTRAARKIIEAGGTLRDVQELLGHASLAETHRYIDQNPDAQKRVVGLI